jgi:hypothetical protein
MYIAYVWSKKKKRNNVHTNSKVSPIVLLKNSKDNCVRFNKLETKKETHEIFLWYKFQRKDTPILQPTLTYYSNFFTWRTRMMYRWNNNVLIKLLLLSFDLTWPCLSEISCVFMLMWTKQPILPEMQFGSREHMLQHMEINFMDVKKVWKIFKYGKYLDMYMFVLVCWLFEKVYGQNPNIYVLC